MNHVNKLYPSPLRPAYIDAYINPHISLLEFIISSKSDTNPYILLLGPPPHHPSSQFSTEIMSGVWVFKNGVLRLVENPGEYQGSNSRRKVLVHVPSEEVITSYSVLERKLTDLGWERYYDDPDLLQFHKRSTVHLISLPKDFSKFKSMHMYDIVVKNRNEFEVRDM